MFLNCETVKNEEIFLQLLEEVSSEHLNNAGERRGGTTDVTSGSVMSCYLRCE